MNVLVLGSTIISSISLTSRVLNKCSPQEGNLFVFDNNRLTLNCPWALTSADKIIANPNCSTIQMLIAIAPIHRKYTITRLIISTYQSITGTGRLAVNQLNNEYNNVDGEMAYQYQIHQISCIKSNSPCYGFRKGCSFYFNCARIR